MEPQLLRTRFCACFPARVICSQLLGRWLSFEAFVVGTWASLFHSVFRGVGYLSRLELAIVWFHCHSSNLMSMCWSWWSLSKASYCRFSSLAYESSWHPSYCTPWVFSCAQPWASSAYHTSLSHSYILVIHQFFLRWPLPIRSPHFSYQPSQTDWSWHWARRAWNGLRWETVGYLMGCSW